MVLSTTFAYHVSENDEGARTDLAARRMTHLGLAYQNSACGTTLSFFARAPVDLHDLLFD